MEHPSSGLGLVGPAGLGWPPGGPSKGTLCCRHLGMGSPVGPSAQRRRPDLPPIGAARGGRAVARPPSAAPGRRPGGPCEHEKCFSARPEGKLRLFFGARAGARVANRGPASVLSPRLLPSRPPHLHPLHRPLSVGSTKIISAGLCASICMMVRDMRPQKPRGCAPLDCDSDPLAVAPPPPSGALVFFKHF